MIPAWRASPRSICVRRASATSRCWRAASGPGRAHGQNARNAADAPLDRDRIDFVFHTLGRNEGNLDAARAYIAWEVGLVARLDDQERSTFRIAGA